MTRDTRFKLELAGIGFVISLVLLMLMLWAPNPPHPWRVASPVSVISPRRLAYFPTTFTALKWGAFGAVSMPPASRTAVNAASPPTRLIAS